jgi:hypothetical protein
MFNHFTSGSHDPFSFPAWLGELLLLLEHSALGGSLSIVLLSLLVSSPNFHPSLVFNEPYFSGLIVLLYFSLFIYFTNFYTCHY